VARAKHAALVSGEQITQSILVFRGHKVLLHEDLATLYGVATGVLVQAVKRNIRRFPADFMFQLTAAEWTVLRSRIVIPTPSRGGRRFAPLCLH
jgi:ORF6N domain